MLTLRDTAFMVALATDNSEAAVCIREETSNRIASFLLGIAVEVDVYMRPIIGRGAGQFLNTLEQNLVEKAIEENIIDGEAYYYGRASVNDLLASGGEGTSQSMQTLLNALGSIFTGGGSGAFTADALSGFGMGFSGSVSGSSGSYAIELEGAGYEGVAYFLLGALGAGTLEAAGDTVNISEKRRGDENRRKAEGAAEKKKEDSESGNTKHGDQRLKERGFTDEKVADIVENYSQKLYQEGGRTVYAKKNGNYYDVIIKNADDEIVTAVGENSKSLKTWKDVTKMQIIMADIVRYHIKIIERKNSLAYIENLEENLKFEICFKKNEMLDYNPERSDYENWIPFTLCLNLPNRQSVIDEGVKATMTICEVKNFIHGIENVIVYLGNQEEYIYIFNSSESFFELKLEGNPEDNVVEIELWIDVGSQTQGKLFGFDEGVRFVSSKDKLSKFLRDLKKDFYAIKHLQISKE